MKFCSYCDDKLGSPIEAKHCINCGALFQANTGKTHRLNQKSSSDNMPYGDLIEYGTKHHEIGPFIPLENEPIYMTRAQVWKLLQDEHFSVRSPNMYEPTEYRYFGREVIVID